VNQDGKTSLAHILSFLILSQIYGFIWNYQGLFSIIFSVLSNSYKNLAQTISCNSNFISSKLFTDFKDKTLSLQRKHHSIL